MLLNTQVGPTKSASTSQPPLRSGILGDAIVSELHGRFYEQAFQGNLYSNGTTATALTANTITLTATTTPILGVWNPLSSTSNLVILQAQLQLSPPVSAAAMGTLVWATSINNAVISTGTAPFSRKTLTSTGAQGKGMAFVALTGLTNNLVIQFTSQLPAQTLVGAATASAPYAGVENFDGSLIIPPGGVLALLNTVSNTTMLAGGNLLWEEVPIS